MGNITQYSYTLPDGSNAGGVGALFDPTETRYPTFTQSQRYDPLERPTSQTLLNPNSLQTVTAWLEPSLAQAEPETHYQFERLGYFVTDKKDHSASHPVFNRVTGLKDSWGK